MKQSFKAGDEVRVIDPRTGGAKGRKAERYDLLPFDALDEVARVYGVGAQKYEEFNWLKGYSWRLSLGALLRHVARFACGEDRDPETGCLHLAHACWHCLTMITFYMRGLGTDDRAKSHHTYKTWTELKAAKGFGPENPSWLDYDEDPPAIEPPDYDPPSSRRGSGAV